MRTSVTISTCSLLLHSAAVLLLPDSVVGSNNFMTSLHACFVSPIAFVRSHGQPQMISFHALQSPSVVRHEKQSQLVQLRAAKRSGPSTTTTATKKIQVKLLKYVAGTGQPGDIVMVTPAFFQNKLRPSKSAELITDEQVEKQRAGAAAAEKELNESATLLQEKLSSSEVTLTFVRKSGPGGHLFGGIGQKVIAEELKKQPIGSDFFSSRGVKIVCVVDSDGNKLPGDIKHTGEFTVSIALTKDVFAQLHIVVQAEH
jgi:large subunit ribosomal protein L9